jgi:hypothetical protein
MPPPNGSGERSIVINDPIATPSEILLEDEDGLCNIKSSVKTEDDKSLNNPNFVGNLLKHTLRF